MASDHTTAASGAASQPEALRCAEWLELIAQGGDTANIRELARTTAAGLCRLHALTTAAPAAQEAQEAEPAAAPGFPPRILALLREVASRNPPPGRDVREDDRGEPLQDDADAALAWIAARPQADAGAPRSIKITTAMAMAGQEMLPPEIPGRAQYARDVFAAMLAAAPPAPAAGAAPSDCPHPESPSPAGWITNNTDWQRGCATIYAQCWRPGGIPHPLDIPMFTLDQMNAQVDADRANRRAPTAAPAAGAGAAPTDAEIDALWREATKDHGDTTAEFTRWFARAACARWGAAAPAQEAEDGWMPIETAPRNGRVLLLGYYNSHGKWRTLRGEWVDADQIAEFWEEEAEPGWYETSVEAEDPPNAWPTNPTHWRLPPAPPAARARQEGGAA